MNSDERLNYKVNLKHENEDVKKVEKTFKIVNQHDETRALLAEENIGMIPKGPYTFRLQASCEYGTSEWSEPFTANKDDVRILCFHTYRIFIFYKEGFAIT